MYDRFVVPTLALFCVILAAVAVTAGDTNFYRIIAQDSSGGTPTCSNAASDGEICAEGDIEALGDLYASDDVTAGDDLISTDDVTVGDDLVVTGDASVGGNIGGAGTLLILSSGTSVGWEAAAAANQACSTTCAGTGGCVFGFDAGTTALVACDSGLADTCVCAGPAS